MNMALPVGIYADNEGGRKLKKIASVQMNYLDGTSSGWDAIWDYL